MPAPTPFSIAALKSELTTDPAKVGYATPIASGADNQVAALINAINSSYAFYLPIDGDELLTWATANAVLINIDEAVNATGAFSSITTANRNAARGVQYLLAGSYVQPVAGTLDITDARVVGLMSDGTAYVTGDTTTLTTPGLIDALVAAGVLVSSSGTSLKDSLLAAGKVSVSRATALWGYNATTNPTGPTTMSISALQVSQALRG